MPKLKKWVLYITFITVTIVFLIYYLFPSEFVKRYIIYNISQIDPALEVSIGHVSPTFPPGLRLDTVSFEYSGIQMLLADEMRVVPKLASLLAAKRILLFSVNAYSGSVNGIAYIIGRNKKSQLDMEAAISGMQLADIPIIKNQSEVNLSGVLKMEIRLQTRPQTGYTIRAKTEMVDIELQSAIPFFNQGFIAFERIEAYLFMRDDRIDLKSCNFTGEQFDGMLSGFGVLKNPVNKSTIKLSGSLNPHHPFPSQQDGNMPFAILNMLKPETGDISFSIKGPIENLSFSFE